MTDANLIRQARIQIGLGIVLVAMGFITLGSVFWAIPDAYQRGRADERSVQTKVDAEIKSLGTCEAVNAMSLRYGCEP